MLQNNLVNKKSLEYAKKRSDELIALKNESLEFCNGLDPDGLIQLYEEYKKSLEQNIPETYTEEFTSQKWNMLGVEEYLLSIGIYSFKYTHYELFFIFLVMFYL